MTASENELILHVSAKTSSALQEDLDSAVEKARQAALKGGKHGVLVTQHDYWSYTVSISRDVPFGSTREQRNTLNSP